MRRDMMGKKLMTRFLSVFLLLCLLISGCSSDEVDKNNEKTEEKVEEKENVKENEKKEEKKEKKEESSDSSKIIDAQKENKEKTVSILKQMPKYSNSAYKVINNNNPYFTKKEITNKSFEYYSDLDSLGRCGVAIASIGKDLMPTEKRGSIGMIKPTGWHTVKYDNVDGKYLYNRCHLIGYQLTAENANEKNLITGTRYLNVEGMLPFENMVADYIKETNNHVMYRVTPDFKGDNLVANGVLMEAYSVEDNGEGIKYCVYAFNSQPNITIDYATGSSSINKSAKKKVDSHNVSKPKPKPKPASKPKPQPAPKPAPKPKPQPQPQSQSYVVNTNTGKFHNPSCYTLKRMKPSNRMDFSGSRDDLINQGYSPCQKCNP